MQKIAKIVICLLTALLVGAAASAAFHVAIEAPEIARWRRTGELRFDHPVTEAYAQRVNQDVHAEILRNDIIRRSHASPLMIALGTAIGTLPGLLLDPLLLLIEAAVFAAVWALWGFLARRD